MLSTEIVRAMIDYHYARQYRLWDSIMTLTDEQFTTEIPYSHGSIRNHMVHLPAVDTRWLKGLREEADARTFNYEPPDYPTRDSARMLTEKVADEVKQYIATLDEEALAYMPQGMPLARWQVILHVVNHGTDHRAQVLRILHDFGAPTFEQDLSYYFFGE